MAVWVIVNNLLTIRIFNRLLDNQSEFIGGITDYKLKKVLLIQTQFVKCDADAEAQIAAKSSCKGSQN